MNNFDTMVIDIKKEISANSSLTLVIKNETYIKTIAEVAKQLSTQYDKICYISLNKLYQPLIKSLQANGADLSKFFFIDGITKTAISEPGDIANCYFVSGPDQITEIGIATQKVVALQKSQILLFDSLSTLLVYKNVQIVKQFVHSIVGQVAAINCISLFTCLEGNVETDLIKDLSMFIDRIVHVSE
jgi:archaellum biogenesis ATPase FlaH